MMTTFVEIFFFLAPYHGKWESISMRAVVVLDVARPAGRVRTRKTIMYVLACAFLSFFFCPLCPLPAC